MLIRFIIFSILGLIFVYLLVFEFVLRRWKKIEVEDKVQQLQDEKELAAKVDDFSWTDGSRKTTKQRRKKIKDFLSR